MPKIDVNDPANRIEALEGILGAVWMHANWRWITRQLTTEQKDLFADAVDAWNARLNEALGHGPTGPVADRWWRDGQ